MTVISAVITRHCTVHASDSMITIARGDGTYKTQEWERSKIVPVPRWRGAMSYWGLAGHPPSNWATVDWLQEQVKKGGDEDSPEQFARKLTDQLREAIGTMPFDKPLDKGIGIHLTAYEDIEGHWIPELFLISNWANTRYNSLRPGGIGLSRETYHTVARVPPDPDHREPEYRLQVYRHLHTRGGILIYNNGDPRMFNPAAGAILNSIGQLAARGKLKNPRSVETYLDMARRPIEIVAAAQRDFCREGTRVVGGKPHDLAVTPQGEYYSNTGDDSGW
jgi:hypothetical protein